MFGFSWSEILIIGVVALVFIGPNDLPRAMKTAARWMSAGRKLAREFQGHVDDLIREAELDELRDQARKLATEPVSKHIESIVDPDREISQALQMPDELHPSFWDETMASPAARADAVPVDAVPAEPAAAPEIAPPTEKKKVSKPRKKAIAPPATPSSES
jgi:sec-independent protein translocase protein TatB